MKKIATPPNRGASNSSAFFDAGMPFAPASVLLNVMPYDTIGNRPRFGTRPGMSEYFTGGPFGSGRFVQGMGVVSRGRTQTGYTKGASTDLIGTDGGARTQGAIAGNVWRLDNTLGLTAYAYENVTATGPYADTGVNTQPNRSVNAIAQSPDGTRIIIGESYADGSGNNVSRITCLNATTLALIWSKKMSDAGIDRFVSAIDVSADWVFVCTNHFLRIFRLTDGSNPSAIGSAHNTYSFGGWSQVAVDCKVDPAGSTLYGLFRGTNATATLGSGIVVTAGITAEHFRAGVMKYAISTAAQLIAGTSTEVLTQVNYSPQLLPAATYYEGVHQYLRFSEQVPWGPRGMRPTGLALLPSGGIVVTCANQAWGPCAVIGDPGYFPPDGTTGYYNLFAFSPAGVYLWRFDGDSIKYEDGGSGFFNDLLSPTAIDVATDSSGNVYFGGRRTLPTGNPDGMNVWGVTSLGDFIWSSDLQTTIKGVAVLPGSMNVAVGGLRSNAWPGASSAYAQLWTLRSVDGAIASHLPDIGSVSVLGLIGETGDAIGFVSEKA